ncbi:MAG: type VI secretion system baseplate subunit TssG [Pseudomonadota bacterium]
METPQRAGPDDLTHFAEMIRRPEQFNLLLALRVIEAHFSDAPRLGESRRPSEDPMRLRQEAELAFPPSTIASVTAPEGGKPGKLDNRFFGLFGPHGPLPMHLTEYARDRLRNHRDPTMVEFANMLTHRMMSLFYRAWAVARPAPSFDRGSDAAFERKVAAISGHMGRALHGRDAMPDLAKRHFAGHLAAGPKHGEGLVSMLSAFVRAPVRLQQFVGSWLELEPDDRWQLGARAGLGQATSIGSRVWTRAAKFRLRIGPMGLEEYRRLLPGGPSLARVDALVRNYIGDRLDWDVNLVLKGAEVPQPILGSTASLGQTLWIGHRKPGRDADELFVNPAMARPGRAQ